MRSYWLVKSLKIMAVVAVAVLAFGFLTMHLWNWLLPGILGVRPISFVQALGLLILSKILFGGFHRHGGRGRGWNRRKMEERLARMTPEERERFRSGMRRRCGRGPVPPETATAART
jgi:hypothetical protein